MLEEYTGFTSWNKASGDVRRAITCFNNQLMRCTNPKNPRYKDNGAKGIMVEYTVRQFIAWYLKNKPLFTGKNPSVGRIDHSMGYSFDNIRFESLEENSLERIKRLGPTRPKKKVTVIDFDTKRELFVCESVAEAERKTGVWGAHIAKYCNGLLISSREGYTFKWSNQ